MSQEDVVSNLICVLIYSLAMQLKGNAQFVQKVTFEPLMEFKLNHYMEVGNITKASTFKSFLHVSC